MSKELIFTAKQDAIPESVLKAERTLRKKYPWLHRKISGYRNQGQVSEDEMFRIEMFSMIEAPGVEWEKLLPLVNAFTNYREPQAPKKTKGAEVQPKTHHKIGVKKGRLG
jgi:hypothetical protein